MAQVTLELGEADGYLPPVCMCCGEPASATKVRTMAWTPPWVGVLIFAGLLPYVIIAAVMTKRATVEVPLCERHQWHWLNRNLLMWGSFFLFGLVGAAGLTIGLSLQKQDQDMVMPFVCIGCFVLLVVWLVIAIACQNTAIRPSEITEYEITLTGVCRAFIDAVDEARATRRFRKRERRRYDDDDYDDRRRRSDEYEEDDEPRPRRRKPPSDAIEE
jgi:hypothetical protein